MGGGVYLRIEFRRSIKIFGPRERSGSDRPLLESSLKKKVDKSTNFKLKGIFRGQKGTQTGGAKSHVA